MHFQNIHTFTYQKALLYTLLLLVFKVVESLQCIFKQTNGKLHPMLLFVKRSLYDGDFNNGLPSG